MTNQITIDGHNEENGQFFAWPDEPVINDELKALGGNITEWLGKQGPDCPLGLGTIRDLLYGLREPANQCGGYGLSIRSEDLPAVESLFIALGWSVIRDDGASLRRSKDV